MALNTFKCNHLTPLLFKGLATLLLLFITRRHFISAAHLSLSFSGLRLSPFIQAHLYDNDQSLVK